MLLSSLFESFDSLTKGLASSKFLFFFLQHKRNPINIYTLKFKHIKIYYHHIISFIKNTNFILIFLFISKYYFKTNKYILFLKCLL